MHNVRDMNEHRSFLQCSLCRQHVPCLWIVVFFALCCNFFFFFLHVSLVLCVCVHWLTAGFYDYYLVLYCLSSHIALCLSPWIIFRFLMCEYDIMESPRQISHSIKFFVCVLVRSVVFGSFGFALSRPHKSILATSRFPVGECMPSIDEDDDGANHIISGVVYDDGLMCSV